MRKNGARVPEATENGAERVLEPSQMSLGRQGREKSAKKDQNA